MPTLTNLLALPAALLTLIATTPIYAETQLWSGHNALHTLHGDDDQAQTTLLHHTSSKPPKVRKMSEDEGEKFFLHYWDFGEQEALPRLSSGRHWQDEQASAVSNTTFTPALYPPYAPHIDHNPLQTSRLRFLARGLFGRQSGWGSCPGNTFACSEIGEENSCCNEGERCFLTDAGEVGCCPDGQTCGTTVEGCDTAEGYSSCPGSENGGCCIPGYSCAGVGCVIAATSTVFTTLPVETVTTGIITPSTSTTVITLPNTIVVPASSLTRPDTSPPVPATSSESYTSTTTVTAIAPVRPTSASGSASAVPQPETTTTIIPPATCPGGYYMCSAVYRGDCCRVGRDCDTTSCPPTAYTTILASDSATVVVPYTSTTVVGSDATVTRAGSDDNDEDGDDAEAAESQGNCAAQWYQCGASEGGGCCPRGYVCGDVCTATDADVADIEKSEPSGAEVVRWAWGLLGLGVAAGVGMMVL